MKRKNEAMDEVVLSIHQFENAIRRGGGQRTADTVERVSGAGGSLQAG